MRIPKRSRTAVISKILFFLAVVLMIYFLFGRVWIKHMRYPLKFEEEIKTYSEKYSVDPYMVASIIWAESRFLPDAVSGKDARGLMQLLPGTAVWAAGKMGLSEFEEAMLLDPEMNIRIGCWYLKFLSSQFPDNEELVLAAYNGGIGNVQEWLKDKTYSGDGCRLDHIPFQETRDYVLKVKNACKIYRETYPSLGSSSNRKGSNQ